MKALWLRLTPALFVLLWSTGFIGARLGMPHAEPMTFLSLRFALTAALLLACGHRLAGTMASPRGRLGPPRSGRAADARRLSRRRVRRDPPRPGGGAVGPDRRACSRCWWRPPHRCSWPSGWRRGAWLGLGLGLVGVALVLGRKLGSSSGDALGGVGLSAVAGRHHRRARSTRSGSAAAQDLRTGNLVQFAAAAAVVLAGVHGCSRPGRSIGRPSSCSPCSG